MATLIKTRNFSQVQFVFHFRTVMAKQTQPLHVLSCVSRATGADMLRIRY
jgi:hypothetical protein